MNECPICAHNTIVEYLKPIEYWTCLNCLYVFVIEPDRKIITVLDHVQTIKG